MTPTGSGGGIPKAEPVKKQILVVDDDVSVRELLGRVLAGEGYGVREAANGPEALAIAATDQLDLVLLDLNLPGKSGWEVFERLTTSQPLLPVIILTARSNQLFPALAAGAGALLEKPMDFPRLLQVVSRLLAESPAARRARQAGRAAEFIYNPAPNEGDLS
jgi:CheY-like chemotaxis protein